MHHIVEYTVFGVLMCANLGLGLFFACNRGKKAKTTDEMFLGSRTLRTLPLAMSVLASMCSAIGIIGFSGHYYTFGFHYLWNYLSAPIVALVVGKVVIPVLYDLKVTSVFEYLRLRFGNKIGLTACGLYFFISQTIGAAALFAASVAISTLFHVPVLWSTVAIGIAGTVYTALGGLRGVVWTDCIQAVLILMAPITVVVKVVYDAHHKNIKLRPMSDFNVKAYFMESSLDFTKDENVWAVLIGLFVHSLFRAGMDQVVVQRYLAARKLDEAQRTAYIGVALNSAYNIIMAGMALALVYWYRDCDPMLSGAISKLDQILPYYVKENLSDFPGFSGMFLTGVACAATSTISSIINSQAAVFYVDVIAPYTKLSDAQAMRLNKQLALLFGLLMTLCATAVPYLGSVVRIILVMHNGATGPFVGLFLLALAFPWANSKGAAIATCLTTGLQFWLVMGKIIYNIQAPKMTVTLDYCPASYSSLTINSTSSLLMPTTTNGHQDVLPFYNFSAYWSAFFAALVTVVLGLSISLATGGRKNWRDHTRLTSGIFLKLWRRIGVLPVETVVAEKGAQEELADILRNEFYPEYFFISNQSNV